MSEILPVRIGGSDIGNILGDGYKSPRRLYYEKAGMVDKFEGNSLTEMGNELEQPILKIWADRNGYEVISDGIFNDIQADYQYSDTLIIGAQIDGLVRKDGKYWLVEIKTTGNPANAKDYTPPESYICQACWGLHKVKLLNLGIQIEGSILVCWAFGRWGRTEHERPIGYNQAWFDYAVTQAEIFAECCIQCVEPELIGHDDELDTLKGLDRQEDEVVDLPELEKLVAEMQSHKALIKEWQSMIDHMQAEILDKMGTATAATAGKYKITCNQVNKAAYTVKPQSYRETRIKEMK